jgi:pyruvate formate lyase activating enzyme
MSEPRYSPIDAINSINPMNSMNPTNSMNPINPNMTKRDFLKFCGAGVCALSIAGVFPKVLNAQVPQRGLVKTKLSPFFTSLGGGEIRCELCPRRCRVPRGQRGFCRVRENRDGKYYSLVYGNPCAIHLDPIEKKPFFHVLPATNSFSLATAGCNFQCKFCQNWEISQASPEDLNNYDLPPEFVAKKAREAGARSVAYTYVEPMIFYEYMYDICQLVRKAGLLNVCHSNGFINLEPLRNLCKVMDAANIDLKGFTEDFYRDVSNGELAPVLETLKAYRQAKVHLEITNLLIPTKNDDMNVVKEMCLWIGKELGSETPIHFSRFYPLYKLKSLPATPVSTLEKARSVAMAAGLEYVYIGNVPGHEGENTFCPKCKKMVIKRTSYVVGEVNLKEGKCKFCGKPIPGIWT